MGLYLDLDLTPDGNLICCFQLEIELEREPPSRPRPDTR